MSQMVLIAALTQLSIMVITPTLPLAIECHGARCGCLYTRIQLLSLYLFSKLVAAVSTVKFGPRGIVPDFLRDVGAPGTHLSARDLVKGTHSGPSQCG